MTSEILLYNPDVKGSARADVSIYDPTGAVVFSALIRVKENTTKHLHLPASLGNKFVGSARISCSKPIRALVLDSNGTDSTRGAYQAIRTTSRSVTLPPVRHLSPATQNSIVAVQNASPVVADATLTGYDQNGNETFSQPMTLEPFTSRYVNTDDLCPRGTFIGSARITSTQPVAAAEINLYRRDTATLQGLTASDAENKIPPATPATARTMCSGIQYDGKTKTILALFNTSKSQTATVGVRAFAGKTGDQLVDAPVEIKPHGTLVLTRNDAPLSSLPENFDGSVYFNVQGGARQLIIAVKTLSLNANGHPVGASGYVCR